ncbi:MAG: Ig-like domain-containing protein [Gemmatimonadales bacterium]|nr:Ig-like domain-containing protein [Gemmatimonadales bacterium]
MLLLALLLQQPAPAPAGPIARVQVSPASTVRLTPGDSLRLEATAIGADGRPLPGAVVRWFQAGGRMEGRVDSTGLVVARSTGSLVAAARVAVPGASKTEFVTVQVLPGPLARLDVAPAGVTLVTGQSRVLAATPRSREGDPREDEVTWTSSAPAVAAVSPAGRVRALAPGRATITARVGRVAQAVTVTVAATRLERATVRPAQATVRTGDVVRLAFAAEERGGRAAPGIEPEWSLAGGGGASIDADGGFVAERPGTYRVLATVGAVQAEAVITVRPREATRPATMVGRLPIPHHATEFWLHPNGKAGYLATLGPGIVYALDLADPASPRITDSVVVDARTVNDIMTTEDGKFGVMTREGASNRKNGIVILSFEDPLHPKPVAEFTETVSGGVHSTFVYRGHVYLTDDATGSLRVIDIRDPYKPKQVARWETPGETGRSLHDVDVQDGLAYVSYWNDGLIILDVGNGVKGGRPDNPVFVSQVKYDLNALYKDVEAVGGPGFIRGTHTAWRHGNYVFLGDEVFAAKSSWEGGPLGLGRAYGRLHVVDVSDLLKPKLVAWYEPKDGGAHNVWVAGDTLYLGDYQGGLRVIDIAGELRGDLLAQGREIAHVMTADRRGMLPMAPMTWGAIVRDGLIYTADMNGGLFIVRVESKQALQP